MRRFLEENVRPTTPEGRVFHLNCWHELPSMTRTDPGGPACLRRPWTEWQGGRSQGCSRVCCACIVPLYGAPKSWLLLWSLRSSVSRDSSIQLFFHGDFIDICRSFGGRRGTQISRGVEPSSHPRAAVASKEVEERWKTNDAIRDSLQHLAGDIDRQRRYQLSKGTNGCLISIMISTRS